MQIHDECCQKLPEQRFFEYKLIMLKMTKKACQLTNGGKTHPEQRKDQYSLFSKIAVWLRPTKAQNIYRVKGEQL